MTTNRLSAVPVDATNFQLISKDKPPLVKIVIEGRTLLTLEVKDGVLTADYDPADLDTAARMFAERVCVVTAEMLR